MWRRWVRAGLVGMVAWCSGTLAHAQCTMDLECKADRICEDGACTPPRTPPVAPAPTSGAAVSPPAASSMPAASPPPPPPPPVAPPVSVAPPLPPPLVRRSRAMMAGGIIMATTGSLFIVLALVASSDERCPQSEPQSDAVVRCRHDASLSTYTLGITGVALAGFGVPMLVYGSQRVPANPGARASVLPWVTANAAGVRLRLDL